MCILACDLVEAPKLIAKEVKRLAHNAAQRRYYYRKLKKQLWFPFDTPSDILCDEIFGKSKIVVLTKDGKVVKDA